MILRNKPTKLFVCNACILRDAQSTAFRFGGLKPYEFYKAPKPSEAVPRQRFRVDQNEEAILDVRGCSSLFLGMGLISLESLPPNIPLVCVGKVFGFWVRGAPEQLIPGIGRVIKVRGPVHPDPEQDGKKNERTSRPDGLFTIVERAGWPVYRAQLPYPRVDRIDTVNAMRCNTQGARRLLISPKCTSTSVGIAAACSTPVARE